MIHSNIFIPRNDWAVKTMNYKKYSTINLCSIIGEVIDKLNISKADFVSKSRKRELVDARQIYFYRAKRLTNHSLEKIGSKVQNGDHATVIHGIRQVATVPSLRQKYNELFCGAKPVKEIKPEIKPVKKDEHKTTLHLYGVPTYN